MESVKPEAAVKAETAAKPAPPVKSGAVMRAVGAQPPRRRRRRDGRLRGQVRRLPDRRRRLRRLRVLDRNGRGVLADWMIMAGALVLFGSLFLTWSHQLSPSLLARFGASDVLRGIPRDPTAWQVYSIADALLAGLAVALAVIAAAGGRTARLTVAGAAAIGLAFVLHATSTPPTNGANIVNPALTPPAYYANSPSAGVGATVAAYALAVALAGLALSFTAD